MADGFDEGSSLGAWSEGDWGETSPPLEPPRPSTATAYQLGAILGRGGMGVVYAARDPALGRDLALKTLPAGTVGSRVAAARLAREAALTSRLDHPNIIAVLDHGVLPDGRPFYGMPLVRGSSLRNALDRPSDLRSAGDQARLLRALLAVAEGVAAAHDAGVVHRDLKPENVLLGERGEVRIIDWGLATPVPAAEGRWPGLPPLHTSGMVGTRRYMSPEQAAGAAPDPTHDVWSLGRILEEVAGIGAPAELSAVVARATASQGRYPDAGALAEDLLAWFEGRRVAAHAYSPTELLARTLRAWRGPLTVGAVATVVLVGVVVWGWTETRASLARALVAEQQTSEALADVQLDQAQAAAIDGDRRAAELAAADVLRRREDPVARGVLAAFSRAGRPRLQRDAVAPGCAWAVFVPQSTDLICGSGSQVSRISESGLGWVVDGVWAGARMQGQAIVVWTQDGEVGRLDLASGAEVQRLPREMGDWEPLVPPRRLRWTGGELPASGCHGSLQVAIDDGGEAVGMCEDGVLVVARPGDEEARRVPTEAIQEHVATALSRLPDGTVVVGTVRGRLLHIDPHSGATLARVDTRLGAVWQLTASPDGRHILVSGAVGGVGVWRRDREGLVTELPASRNRAVGFVDDHLVAVYDDRIRVWEIPAGRVALHNVGVGLGGLAASADGGRLAVVGGGGTVRVVDVWTGLVERYSFGTRVVKAAAFGASGLLVAGMDGPKAGHWSGETWSSWSGARPLRRLTERPDGLVVGIDMDHGLVLWSDPGSPPVRVGEERTFVDLDRDGNEVAALALDGQAMVLDGTTLRPIAAPEGARSLAHRGEWWAWGTEHSVVVFGPGGRWSLPVPETIVLDVALSPNRRRVAAAGLDGRVFVWSLAPDAPRAGVLVGHKERVASIGFLADGDLASVGWDGQVRVWGLDVLDRDRHALVDEIVSNWSPEGAERR